MNKFCWFFLLLFSFHLSYSQSASKYAELADEAFEAQNFDQAIPLYLVAIEKQNRVLAWQYNLADSYRAVYEYEQAAYWYRQVFRNKEDDFPLARFHYAQSMKFLGDYQRAGSAFRMFYRKQIGNSEWSHFVRKARDEYQYCELFANEIPFDDSIFLHTLTKLNTGWSEYNPLVTVDSLFWWGSLQPDTLRDNFNYLLLSTHSEKLSFEIQTDTILIDSVNVYSFSRGRYPDEIFFSKCPGKNQKTPCKIFQARWKNGELVEKIEMPEPINQHSSDARHPQFALCQGIPYLIFSSNRPGGYGNYDIYVANLIDQNVWNAGETINSPDDEITPFYHEADQSLFFSSSWYGSLGGFDVFRSYTSDLKSFSPPHNLASPINSSFDEIFFHINPYNQLSYFVSNRPLNDNRQMNCCYDMYYFESGYSISDSVLNLREINARLAYQQKLKAELMSLNPISLFFDNDQPNPGSIDSISDANFKDLFHSFMNQKQQYITEYTKGLSGKNKEEASDTIIRFFEEEALPGMNDLSYLLDRIVFLLGEGLEVEIILRAHASPLNSEEYNYLLSQRRISSLLNYIDDFKGDVLEPFLDSGQLRIKEQAFGESQSSYNVSDDGQDLRSSVFSPEAAKARKIEIIAIQVRD